MCASPQADLSIREHVRPGQLRQRVPHPARGPDRRVHGRVAPADGGRVGPRPTGGGRSHRTCPAGPGGPRRGARGVGLVQRRGTELGGEAAELGRLAGEQEQAFRTLNREQDRVDRRRRPPTSPPPSSSSRAAPGSRSLPAARSSCLHAVAAELVAVVAACLDNVAPARRPRRPCLGAARGAPDRVEISVRDEGRGIPAGRLERPRPRAGSASASRSGAGSGTSGGRRPSPPARTAPSGSSSCPGRTPMTIHASHPVRRPRPGSGPPAPGPARQRGDPLDGREGTTVPG